MQIEKPLQLTKFQIFQGTSLDFNGINFKYFKELL